METNKTILITGSSSGIGKATAKLFADKGWNVAATMRNPEQEQKLGKLANIKLFQLDVTDETRAKQVIDEAIQVFGRIDVVFNNAGYGLPGAFEAMSTEQIKHQFDTNVFGAMNVTHTILPYFRKKKTGMIINNTSMGGLMTFPLYSVYHASKWALEGFMESLQYELRPLNIKVKNIEPGGIKTNFIKSWDFASNVGYHSYVQSVQKNMADFYKTAPGPEVVAKKVFQAANDRSFRLRYPVGGNGPILLFLRWLFPLSWFTAVVRSQVEKGYKK